MNNARRYCTTQYEDGSATSNMQMQKKTCVPQMSGFAGVSVCAYGNVGNSREHAYATSSNAESRSGGLINGVMRARDIGQWRIVE